MLLNCCSKKEDKVSLEQMRDEVLAMLHVCFEGEVERSGDQLRVILPDGSAFAVYVCED